MRTNIDINDDLLERAKTITGAKTKRETIDIALKSLIEQNNKRKLADAFGKIKWEGDLKQMRSNS